MDEADGCSTVGHQDDGACEIEASREGFPDESSFPNFGAELRACKEEGKEAARKPGIVYLSRIPPMTGPQRMKKIFSQYGEVGRVFLQPEDKFSRKIRRKRGGGKAKKYTEGWIEFMDKKIAKNIALTFNNTPMGGKKRSHNYHELWNMKYLHRFQWAHLAERLAHERQVRQQRVRTEISQAKRETNFYMKSVELSASLEKRKRQKGREWIEKVRAYKQIVTQEEQEESKPRRSGKVTKNTLGKIFK